jgi:succinoglycan biosynthesis transport protein ExoP
MQRAKEAGFASAMHASTLHIVDAARSSSVPVEPQRKNSAAVGLMLGSLVGVGFAFFKDRHYELLRLPGDAPRYLHLHELGVIPSAKDRNMSLYAVAQSLPWGAKRQSGPTKRDALSLAGWDDDFSLMAEAYRSATLSILLTEAATDKARVFVVASPNASDGKTSVTCNLGVALSKSKLRVLLIDGDLRRPSLHTALGVSNKFGLRDLLRDESAQGEMPETEMLVRTKMPNLWVLPSGPGDEQVVDLLHSENLKILLERMERSFDVVLIDTPPMLMADARLFADQADGVILVLRSGVTMREDAVNALEKFERDGVRVIGTILNDFDPVKQGQSGYYRSYYQYKDDYQRAGARG